MKKAERKFRCFAVLAVFALMTLLLSLINGMNFTLAASDADEITKEIASQNGSFGEARGDKAFDQSSLNKERFGPMGPASPEMRSSLRFFTIAFSKDKSARTVSFSISAFSEEDAVEWAENLLSSGKTGWTRGTYRYRVYKVGEEKFVTVIDQGRELLPSYRILIISAIGGLLSVLISYFILLLIGRKLFSPLEKADRKQKEFIANANRALRQPLTVISGDVELMERAAGPDERTRSIRRQVGKMTALVDKLGTMGIFDDEALHISDFSLSELLGDTLHESAPRFEKAGLLLSSDIRPDVRLTGDPEAMKRLLSELVDNALFYAKTRVAFRLLTENGRILLETENDADLPSGSVNQVFDRFTKLSNAGENDRPGLGLSYVKQIVRSLNGRESAEVKDGVFTLKVAL